MATHFLITKTASFSAKLLVRFKTVPFECTHRELSFEWSCLLILVRLQENELSSVITQTVPFECTRQELTPFGFVYKKMNSLQ